MAAEPAPLDPEVAALTFQRHIDDLWQTGHPDRRGWQRERLDELHTCFGLPALRPDGRRDWYWVKLGATYYDEWPPTVAFVRPRTWDPVTTTCRWWPTVQALPDFALHLHYSGYKDGAARQLVCFSRTAEYYLSGHSPRESEVWRRGDHTLAATLYRLDDVLTSSAYVGPAHDSDS